MQVRQSWIQLRGDGKRLTRPQTCAQQAHQHIATPDLGVSREGLHYTCRSETQSRLPSRMIPAARRT